MTALPPLEDFHDATTGSFLGGMLRAVNSVRARHHAPPVRLHEELNRYARSRMREISPGRQPVRSGKGLRLKTSEVLYWGSSSRRRSGAADACEAVDQWYAEAPEYDFDNPGFNPRASHFTQLVWRRSVLMGAARAVGGAPGKYETFIAVEFEHCGNVEGEFLRNVFPPARRAPRIFVREPAAPSGRGPRPLCRW
ncbi:CAP domain-containing protein (plasmid) [Streptomyces sp. R39]|uniref:CAP domain-containing protein n=1 Tax=Streptomyces sp. R39 TaxID=3238631 RepID=A0AB39R5R9_9ACTN